MLILTMQIPVVPEKQNEFLQSGHALLQRVRQEQGCLSCRLVRDTENDTIFSLVQEWRNRRSLQRHLLSDSFHLLLGAAKVLSDQAEMTISRRESAAFINTICQV